jgi:RNA polymerase-binding transcription factor DksA
VQSRTRDGRAGGTVQVGDIGEISEAGTQGGIDFALLQRKAEALARLDDALERIDAAEYGNCLVCHVEIPEQRLRALPFAVRCTRCEELHEQDQARGHRPAQPQGSPSVLARVAGF